MACFLVSVVRDKYRSFQDNDRMRPFTPFLVKQNFVNTLKDIKSKDLYKELPFVNFLGVVRSDYKKVSIDDVNL